MSMRKEFHIEQDDLIQYALGTLKETQLSTMTAHISMCNVCRGELGRVQVELAAFASVQPETELPSGARDRFMARLSTDSATEEKRERAKKKSQVYLMSKSFQHWMETPIPMRILSGALAAAVLFFAYDDASHVHEIRQLQPAIKRLAKDTAELEQLKQFLSGEQTQQVSLHPKPLSEKPPEGHAIYSAATGRLVFTASNMAPVPPGKAYELWVLPASGGAPIAAGTFVPDRQGNGAIIFPEIPPNVQAGGFGITVEDAKGSATPTSPILLSGQ